MGSGKINYLEGLKGKPGWKVGLEEVPVGKERQPLRIVKETRGRSDKRAIGGVPS